MRGIREPFPTTVRVSALRLGLLALVAATIVGSLYLSRHRYGQFVMAARPGLDGPDIDLLERENKGYERIIQATTPSIVYIRTEQVVKAEQSPLFMDPSLRQFFGEQFPQIPREQRQHALDRKSTRLNSSHTVISYAVFCLKKKQRRKSTPRAISPT